MKDNLHKVDSIVKEWDRPLMERKPKPVEKDEFDRMQKGQFSFGELPLMQEPPFH